MSSLAPASQSCTLLIKLIHSVVLESATFTVDEIARWGGEMTITIGLGGEMDQEIAETDLAIGNDPQTDGDTGAESVTTVTGEMIPLTGLEDAAGILLTLGPVAEAKIIAESLQPEPKLRKLPRYVDT